MTISKYAKGLSAFLSLILFYLPLSAWAESPQEVTQTLKNTLHLERPEVWVTRQKPVNTHPDFLSGESYLLEQGDTLNLHLWNARSEKRIQAKVQYNGQIVFAHLGAYPARGKTIQQIEHKIQQTLPQNEGWQAVVTLERTRPLRILITGYIANPGYYPMPQGTHLMSALQTAGGILDNGSLRRIQLKTPTGERSIDLLQFQYQGNRLANPVLKNNWQIHIPELKEKIALAGEFARPGIYELKGDHWSELMARSGGLKPTADRNALLRWPGSLGNQHQQTVVPYTIGSVFQSDDILFSPARKLPGESRALYIYGQVNRPGLVPFRKDLTLEDCLRLAGGPTQNAELTQVTISRQTDQGRKVLEVNLQDYIYGKTEYITAIESGDVIFVPETFFNVRNITEWTTLLVSTLGIVSVVINLSQNLSQN